MDNLSSLGLVPMTQGPFNSSCVAWAWNQVFPIIKASVVWFDVWTTWKLKKVFVKNSWSVAYLASASKEGYASARLHGASNKRSVSFTIQEKYASSSEKIARLIVEIFGSSKHASSSLLHFPSSSLSTPLSPLSGIPSLWGRLLHASRLTIEKVVLPFVITLLSSWYIFLTTDKVSSWADSCRPSNFTYTAVSRVSAHGHINITRNFGPHGHLPGI